MESSDNKTPRAVSGRPSLLSPPAGGTPDKNSQTRMLASLERDGKIPASVSARNKPSRKKYGIAALAIALVGGIGAFVAFGPFDDAAATVAAAPAPRVIPVTAAEHPASVALAVAAPAPLAASAASATVARIELAAVAVPEAVSDTAVAQTSPLAASQPQVNPLDKLALRDADPSTPPPHATAAPSPARKDKVHGKDGGAKAQAVASAKPAVARADTRAPAARKARKTEDDADTELVAAIIARLDKRGAKPAATAPAPVVVSEATPASVTNQVHQCSSNSDLVEARQCRNRACDGHWGKVDACPVARAPKTSRSDGADSGKRG